MNKIQSKNKNLIKKNFQKSLSTYNQNAVIQKKMAEDLTREILESRKQKEKQEENGNQNKIQNKTRQKPFFKNILEIGCYTGILTNEINKNFDFETYLALDIVDCKNYVKKINEKIDFLKIDVEDYCNLENTKPEFDLIIANASLQWCCDFEFVCEKLKSFLRCNGVLAFSIFDCDNLIEIKDIFNIGLKYPDINTLEKIFKNSIIIQKKEKLKFSCPLDILRHLKLTGVNSIEENRLNYREIKNKLSKLEEKYQNTLTYSPVYMIYQKIN